MIVVGLDVHKHSLTAVAVDELGRTLAEPAGPVDGLVIEWARPFGEERLWAVEDCRHVTRRLEQTLLGEGERLVRVPPRLTAPQRRRGRSRVKPSEEIRRIVERWMQAISERVAESSLERVSDLPGALMIGTDPEEWFHGAEARAIWARQLGELDSFSVVGTEIEAWEEGTVGWASVKEKISWDDQEAEARAT